MRCTTINMPCLSIIVPCHNSSTTIAQCLKALKTSIYKDHELIVVDDHSNDNTAVIAREFTDKVITLDGNKGSGNARKAGMHASKAEIICFIDSDIIIRPDTLSIIMDFLQAHPEIDAVTGLLSKEHPNQDFFSQYKNLYMNYTFSLLPERVTFLFGSVYAVRNKSSHPDQGDLRHTPDTEYGQKLFCLGKTIAFLKNLEVVHLKKYSFSSLIKNDFWVPFSWGRIFIRFQGWKQLGKNKTGFAHAPQTQLASVMAAPLLILSVAAGLFLPKVNMLLCVLLPAWFILNMYFFIFMFKERGILFLLAGITTTLISQIVMALGIITGFLVQLLKR